MNNTSYELVLLKYTKALITRLKHEEEDYIRGTKWSTKESDEEPGMLTEIKQKTRKQKKAWPKSPNRRQLSDRLVDLRGGAAAFVRSHPLGQQTQPHHISTPASSANKQELNSILKPILSCAEHER